MPVLSGITVGPTPRNGAGANARKKTHAPASPFPRRPNAAGTNGGNPGPRAGAVVATPIRANA
eukprot:204709-Lingulodinium_polyedra.AAC.1